MIHQELTDGIRSSCGFRRYPSEIPLREDCRLRELNRPCLSHIYLLPTESLLSIVQDIQIGTYDKSEKLCFSFSV